MKTFGSDPELLITNKGVPKSAIGVVQGSPTNRINIEGHEFYYDNVLAEMAIKPSKSKQETLHNIKEALQIYADMVKPFKLMAAACAEFPAWELEHEEAKNAGCKPDWCAYEVAKKDPPKGEIERGRLRSCGGHIHIGTELMTSSGPEPILGILMLDLFLGVPSVWIDSDPNSIKRRALYGQAGRYRTQDYGIEYRSLSNFWLASPELVEFVYDVSMFAMDFVESGKAWEMWSFDEEVYFEADDLSDAWKCKAYEPYRVKTGINSGNRIQLGHAFEVVKQHMPSELLDRTLGLMLGSKRQTDLYKNWGLK